MREALIAAAKASSGREVLWLPSAILIAARKIKPRKFGGWNVIRKGKRNVRRNR